MKADLQLRQQTPARPAIRSREWDGFAIEQTCLEGVDSFSYRRKGATHYLALHDILLEDGETHGGDGSYSTRRDLRGTLTYVPPDCEVSGWSKLADKGASGQLFTALYYDTARISPELHALYDEADKGPVIYGESRQLGWTMDKIAALDLNAVPTLLAEHLCMVAALEALPLLPPSVPECSGGLSPAQFARVTDYIAHHLADDIALPDLAALTGLSRFHFVRAFGKSSGGRSPYGFLQDRRAEQAMRLLRDTILPVTDIAKACGFGGTRPMARAVERLAGMTPTAYRRHGQS